MKHSQKHIYAVLCVILAGMIASRAQDRPPAAASQFSGAWRNDNPKTRSVTRLEVQHRGVGITIHAWGACMPAECDWGIAGGRVDGGTASVTWDQGFVNRRMTLVAAGDRLRMTLDSAYKGHRAPRQTVEYFVRSE
jgi:hypothetical protein